MASSSFFLQPPREPDVKQGSKSNRFLEIGPYFEHSRAKIRSYLRVPYTIIRGRLTGPTFCVTAGIHGTEYTGIGAAIRLAHEVDPAKIRGTVFIVRVANPLAFEEREYLTPIDGVNVQSVWPGDSRGSISNMMAYAIFNNFVVKSDYHIDLHGGDIHETEIAFSIFHKVGRPGIDKKSEGLAKALGYDYVCVSEDSRKSNADESEGRLYKVAPRFGVPSALSEFGEGDRLLQKEVDLTFDGLINALKYAGIIEGKVAVFPEQKFSKLAAVGVDHDGLVYYSVAPGDIVEEGQLLGRVINLEGEVAEEVKAPYSGVVCLMIRNPLVTSGEKVLEILVVN